MSFIPVGIGKSLSGATLSGSVLFTGTNRDLQSDNNNLHWDGTNKRLGIGVSAPSVSLEVSGQIKSDSGGFVFPDGSVQTVAAGAGGSDPLTIKRGITVNALTFSVLGTGITFGDGTIQTTASAGSDPLTINKGITANAITTTILADSSLTAPRIPFTTTGGRFTDNVNLTFDGTSLISTNGISTNQILVGTQKDGWQINSTELELVISNGSRVFLTNGQVSLYNDSSIRGLVIAADDAAGGVIQLYTPSANLKAQIVTVGDSYFNTGGKFGFGNVAPTYDLDVTGVVRATNGLCSTTLVLSGSEMIAGTSTVSQGVTTNALTFSTFPSVTTTVQGSVPFVTSSGTVVGSSNFQFTSISNGGGTLNVSNVTPYAGLNNAFVNDLQLSASSSGALSGAAASNVLIKGGTNLQNNARGGNITVGGGGSTASAAYGNITIQGGTFVLLVTPTGTPITGGAVILAGGAGANSASGGAISISSGGVQGSSPTGKSGDISFNIPNAVGGYGAGHFAFGGNDVLTITPTGATVTGLLQVTSPGASGTVLTNVGNGVAAWSAASGGSDPLTLHKGLTTNALTTTTLFGSGSAEIDGNLYVASDLGIGVPNPLYALDVVGQANIAEGVTTNAITTTYLEVAGSALGLAADINGNVNFGGGPRANAQGIWINYGQYPADATKPLKVTGGQAVFDGGATTNALTLSNINSFIKFGDGSIQTTAAVGADPLTINKGITANAGTFTFLRATTANIDTETVNLGITANAITTTRLTVDTGNIGDLSIKGKSDQTSGLFFDSNRVGIVSGGTESIDVGPNISITPTNNILTTSTNFLATASGQVTFTAPGGFTVTAPGSTFSGTISAGGNYVALDGTTLSSFNRDSEFSFTVDGGSGSLIATGDKHAYVRVKSSFTAKSWEVAAVQNGIATDVDGLTPSIIFDVWKVPGAQFPPTSANSVVSTSPPKVLKGKFNSSSTLTNWTTTFNKGDYLNVSVNAASGITKAILTIIGTERSYL